MWCPVTTPRPRCICVRMTVGTFQGYTARSLLHCGVSDSRGRVYNFDERGAVPAEAWREAASVPLPPAAAALTDAEFDSRLVDFHAAFRLGPAYRALTWNCFDYVVGALGALAPPPPRSPPHTKETLAAVLEPPLMDVIQFVEVSRVLGAGAGRGRGPAPVQAVAVVDTAAHRHALAALPSLDPWRCDVCRVAFPRGAARLHCAPCDFDLCEACGGVAPACSPGAGAGAGEGVGAGAGAEAKDRPADGSGPL